MKIQFLLSITVIWQGLAWYQPEPIFMGPWVQAGSVAGHISFTSVIRSPFAGPNAAITLLSTWKEHMRMQTGLSLHAESCRDKDSHYQPGFTKRRRGRGDQSSFGSMGSGKLVYMDLARCRIEVRPIEGTIGFHSDRRQWKHPPLIFDLILIFRLRPH